MNNTTDKLDGRQVVSAEETFKMEIVINRHSNKRSERVFPGNKSGYPMNNFTKQAQKLWADIPSEVRLEILNSV